jgi:PAS domain S-box-containing protein
MTELLGYSRDEFLGKKIWNIGVFKDIVKNKAAFAKLQQKKEIRYEDLPLETKDGRRIDVAFLSSVYSVDRKKKLIQCHIRDITERKLWEKAVNESEERFRRAFETSRDGLLLLDKQTGNILNANPAATKMLGYSGEELLEKNLKDVGVMKDAWDFKKDLEKIERAELVSYEDEPITTQKGKHIDADIYLIDRAKVAQCNIRDVTERKKTEKELRQSEERHRVLFESSRDAIMTLEPPS